MKFHYPCIVTCFALSVGNSAAAKPVSRTPKESKDDRNRYVGRFPKSNRENLYKAFKLEVINLGGIVQVEVPKKGVIAVSFPDSSSIQAMTKSAGDKGFTFEQDQVRHTTDIKSSSLKTTRKLSEDIPWGITKTYGGDIPALSYYDNLTSKKVCVIDSGYLSNHEDLPDGEVSVNGGSYGDEGICDYHGSHVSGTIGAIGGNGKGVIGVFPSAPDIRVAKVFASVDYEGAAYCGFVFSSALIGAVQACQDSGAEITNMSLGGPSYSSSEDSAFTEFFEEGMINIASSGNSGPNTIKYPSSYSSVISVGATNINDNIAYFSSTNSEVDISAPGVDVLSTVGPGNNYAYYDGTSMACPHVVGATLTLWNKFPDCSNQAVRNALENGADDLGAPGRDDQFGHGRLNYWSSADILADACGVVPTASPTSAPPTVSPVPTITCEQLVLELETDQYPGETSWEVKNPSGTTVVTGTGNGCGQSTLCTYDYCLPSECGYTFTIYDSYGDGICCAYGSGSYTVTYAGVEVAQGSDFGSSESTNFGCPLESDPCVDSPLNAAVGGGTLGCDFIAINPQYCELGGNSHCPLTCGTCDTQKCEDSGIEFTYGNEDYECSFLDSVSQEIKDQACAIDDVVKTCRSNCSYCEE